MVNENNAQKKVLPIDGGGLTISLRCESIDRSNTAMSTSTNDSNESIGGKGGIGVKEKVSSGRGVSFLPDPPLVVDAVAVTQKSRRRGVPPDFVISKRVRDWSVKKGYALTLDARFEDFVSRAKARGYKYIDWDEAFMTACRHDWARLGGPTFKKQVAL
jgi:hypothetical protein